MSMNSASAETLFHKLKVLNERLWEDRAPRPVIDRWLSNFADDLTAHDSEQLNALFLLSQFIYFGDREIRELLKALYRDHFRYPIVATLRRANADSLDADMVRDEFDVQLGRTRFLGMGNPSESGTHLLYYFRQENELPKDLFVSLAELFDRRLNDPNVNLAEDHVRRIVFVDDLCGSGAQARTYSDRVLAVLRSIAQRRQIDLHISYLVLVARTGALERIESDTEFDAAHAVLELDDTHKCLSDDSRHFQDVLPGVSIDVARKLAHSYGHVLWPSHPLGWDNGQLLLGFHHNVPDNSLPIIWWDEPNDPWVPVFPRYRKLYV